MKIDSRRLFTYPVLAGGCDDYKTCKFTAEIAPSFDAANNIRFEISCRTDCTEINRLIANGDAEYLLHVECPSTIYREVTVSRFKNFSCTIPPDCVKEKLDIIAFIVLSRAVKDFFCGDWNDDFSDLKFSLPKGSPLAYQKFEPWLLPDDENIFKNVASIFSVYRKLADNEPFDVKLSEEKIKIGLNAKDYDLYRRYCVNPTMQPILNAMIILPVLVYVFDELKREDRYEDSFEVYGSKGWFLSLKAAYRRRKIDFEEYILLDENTSIKLAQEVMKLPITRALASIAEDS